MLLDDKTAEPNGDDGSFATWLRRFGEVPLRLIGRKRFACPYDLHLSEFVGRLETYRATQ
jgi:hypothetical protein